MKKIVIAGGSGFLGSALAKYFAAQQAEVIILSRKPSSTKGKVTEVYWDGETEGDWCSTLEGAEALINLSGKSVDCRYTPENKKLIYDSRLKSTRVLGSAIQKCIHPPKVWVNSSSATIYRASFDKLMTERDGEIGDDFSMNVCKQWEATFQNIQISETRKIVLRTSIVLDSRGGALVPLQNLAALRLGGPMGNGEQYFSWIHIHDFCNIVNWVIQNQVVGIYNVCSPQPVTNKNFMGTLRAVMKISWGLPLPQTLLNLGARLIRTEPELILKSRKVYPQRLLDEGFVFEFPDLKSALGNLWSGVKRN